MGFNASTFDGHQLKPQLRCFLNQSRNIPNQNRKGSEVRKDIVVEQASPPIPSAATLSANGLRVESNFLSTAEQLREQFEREISSETSGISGRLRFVYGNAAYQYLTVDEQLLFTADARLSLLARLRAWAEKTLGASHVSSPKVRLYAGFCRRELLRDDVRARWHYVLCLSPTGGGNLKVMTDSSTGSLLKVGKLTTTQLKFNDLLVHEVACPYAVEGRKKTVDPLQSHLFLEGYIW
jgi:hypothetical protein